MQMNEAEGEGGGQWRVGRRSAEVGVCQRLMLICWMGSESWRVGGYMC